MRRFFLVWYLIVGIFQVYTCDAIGIDSDDHEAPVAIDDLIFEQDVIFANINGVLHSVHSLEKRDGQWVAQFDFGKEVGYCQRGHDLCYYCRLCHRVGCWYYVEPCWKK
jgi:hypothetical protein